MSATNRECIGCKNVLKEGSNWLSSCVRNHKYRCIECKRIENRIYERDSRKKPRVNTKKEQLRKIKWKKENKGYVNYINSKRAAAKIKRTPKWANLFLIRKIYEECSKLISKYGPNSYHVDHIIPLQGKKVSGFHVENNLQILKAKDNLSKGNKYNE